MSENNKKDQFQQRKLSQGTYELRVRTINLVNAQENGSHQVAFGFSFEPEGRARFLSQSQSVIK